MYQQSLVLVQARIFIRMIADKINTLRSYLLGLPTSLPLAPETSRYEYIYVKTETYYMENMRVRHDRRKTERKSSGNSGDADFSS